MIRPMASADRGAVLDLIRETGFFRPDEVQVAEELIDVYLGHPSQRDYDIVVVVDGEDGGGPVVGYMTWGPTPLTIGTYDLYWMAVSPRAQGRGYGKALVRWLEERVAGQGGRLIVIETSSTPNYEPTRKFYLGLGYRETARVPDFYQSGDDRVIYTKRLI
jgi:ribosomal protein S18 acetylase RimI-like enzyme